MTVHDAYAAIAYLRGGEAASGQVRELLRAPTVLSAVNAAEVIDQLVRIDGNDPDEVEIRLATLEVGGMMIAPATHSQAVAAGSLRARHYNRRTCAVSLADCFAAATALDHGGSLATSDPHLSALVQAEAGTVHYLPEVSG